jgi:hypothetical protein
MARRATCEGKILGVAPERGFGGVERELRALSLGRQNV